MKMYRIAGICMTFLVSTLVAMDPQTPKTPTSPAEKETPQWLVLESPEVPSALRLNSPSHAPAVPLQDFTGASSSSSSSIEQASAQSSKASDGATTLSQSHSASGSFLSSLFGGWWSKGSESVPPTVSQTKPTTPLSDALAVCSTTELQQQFQEEQTFSKAEQMSPRAPALLEVVLTTEDENPQAEQRSNSPLIRSFAEPVNSDDMGKVLLSSRSPRVLQEELLEQALQEQGQPLIKEQELKKECVASTEQDDLLVPEILLRAKSLPILPSHNRRRVANTRKSYTQTELTSSDNLCCSESAEEQTELCASTPVSSVEWVEMVIHGVLVEKVRQAQYGQVPALKSALKSVTQLNAVTSSDKPASSKLVVDEPDEMAEVALCEKDRQQTHQERKRTEKEKEKKAKLVAIASAVHRQSRTVKRQSQSRNLIGTGPSANSSAARAKQKRAKQQQQRLICKQWSKEE